MRSFRPRLERRALPQRKFLDAFLSKRGYTDEYRDKLVHRQLYNLAVRCGYGQPGGRAMLPQRRLQTSRGAFGKY